MTLTADDPRHGTTAGHLAHLKAGEDACAPCVAAKTRYEKIRAVYGNRMVPATGTRRRVRALKAMGHSGADIADRLGVTYQAVHKIEHGTSEWVRRATAENVHRAYEELCMTLPTGHHRTRIRNDAARRGYVPPLGWDNIDDPDETPQGWAYDGSDRGEALTELNGRHAGITEACRLLEVDRKSLDKWCRRHGYEAIYSRMVEREQPDYERLTGGRRAS